ncbi:hypothetical protein MRX96_028671 [Rhipicephalus microplus]
MDVSSHTTPEAPPKHSWYTGTPGPTRLRFKSEAGVPACSSAAHSRSASDLVMRPQLGALVGITPARLSTSSCSGLHRRQKMCRSVHTLLICGSDRSVSTVLRICGRQSRCSPPTVKHEMVFHSSCVSSRSLP